MYAGGSVEIFLSIETTRHITGRLAPCVMKQIAGGGIQRDPVEFLWEERVPVCS